MGGVREAIAGPRGSRPRRRRRQRPSPGAGAGRFSGSLADAFGDVSLGVSVDVLPAAVAWVRMVVAEVSPQLPLRQGDSTRHIDGIDWLVTVDTPVIQHQHTPVATAALQQIALGRVTSEALKHLADRHDLGIHSDVVTDAIIPLIERGILTGRRKTTHPAKIVTCVAMGPRRLYDLIDGSPVFVLQPIICLASTSDDERESRVPRSRCRRSR